MFIRAASLVCVLVLAAILVPSQVDAATVVRITMAGGAGSFDIELNDNTPLQKANFLNYVHDGFYTNTVFHRSQVQPPETVNGTTYPGYSVLQGGGFALPAAGSTNFLDSVSTFPAVAYEGNLGWSNTIGTIGAARGETFNSATSQWYINMADNRLAFDGGYTVFGKIVVGLDVAQALFAEKVWDWTRVLNYATFNRLPLGSSYDGGRWPMQDEFLTIQSALVVSTTSLAAPVPEPATIALLALGLGGLVRRRRRK